MPSIARRVMRFIVRIMKGHTCRKELLYAAACQKAVSDETLVLLKQLNEKMGGGL